MGRHRHVANVRADGIAVVLGPLLRDVRIVAAALVDVESGMVLDAWTAGGALTGAPDLELLGAQHAEIVRCALQLLRTWTGAGEAGACEVVLGADDGCRHLLRTVPDPHGDRLALAVVVDGPQRVLDRVRKRLQAVSVDALTAGPSMTRRPSGSGWSFDPPAPDVPASPAPGASLLPGRPAPHPGAPRSAAPQRPAPQRPAPQPPAPQPPAAQLSAPPPSGSHSSASPVSAPHPGTGARHAPEPVPRPRDGRPDPGPALPTPRGPGAVPAMAGLPRPVPTPPAVPSVSRLPGTPDGADADAGDGIVPVVIPAGKRAAGRPVLFSVPVTDPAPERPPPSPPPPPAPGPRRPSPPAALPAAPRPRPPQT